MENAKVVNLFNSEVYEDIVTFFDELELYNKKVVISKTGEKKVRSNTREAYERNIREFFRMTLDKPKGSEIEFLTIKEIALDVDHIKKYRIKLSKLKKKDSDEPLLVHKTINQKLASVSSLYKHLGSMNKYKSEGIGNSIFDIKKLPEQSNSYGDLSPIEADLMSETVFKTENTKAYLKHCLIQFATRTSFRLSEILNMKWSDIVKDDNTGHYRVKLDTKGNDNRETSFSTMLYNKLIKLKDENKKYKWNKDTEIIFQISKDSINDMMERLRIELNIPEERNIVFHSLRNVAINWIIDVDGDVKAASLHAGHKSIDITYKSYMSKNIDYSQTPGIRMDEELDISFIDQLTLDNFKEFISNGDYKLQMEIKRYFENLHK